MPPKQKLMADDITLCPKCYCMTKNICGKCKTPKPVHHFPEEEVRLILEKFRNSAVKVTDTVDGVLIVKWPLEEALAQLRQVMSEK